MCHDTIKHDNEDRRAENIERYGETQLCTRCDGTGNLYENQYRECTRCNGSGVVVGSQPKQQFQTEAK